MKVPSLKIGSIEIKVPLLQGGMGVKVSLSSLAAAVSNEGCMGTISSIGLGDVEKSKTGYEVESRENFIREIRTAREMTKGPIAVNVMGVLSNSDDLVLTAAREKVDCIAYGAGIPFNLPLLVKDYPVNLMPIISSDRLASIILKNWDRKANRVPDAFILEGPKAGGHLGFSPEQLENIDENSLELILPKILETVKPFEDKYGRKIPVIVAGGIFSGADIAAMLRLGASGVQMASRFVCTHECGVSENFKQAYIKATEDDIVIIKSPVGMPGRAIKNDFLRALETEVRKPIKCDFRCLTACQAQDAQYCIALALVKSYIGDVDNGLLFCGASTHRIKEIVSVKELVAELVRDIEAA
ncbi:MAG: nitronate monooxygenase [Spirochaetes bacterium]|nr:nitronate monooxygenase [Spirochaetota bacterium]